MLNLRALRLGRDVRVLLAGLPHIPKEVWHLWPPLPSLGAEPILRPVYSHHRHLLPKIKTKPIRRYPDLVVHRTLLRELGLSGDPPATDLEDLAEHTSAREREAAQVEYLADELCLAWLLEATLYERGWDDPFEGEIVGIIASGLFIRFGDVFEGYLPARRLAGDYFELNELGTAMAGRRGGRAYRLGDPIEVLVEKIEKAEGRVELAQAGRPQR